jgi:hypothetical protein
MLIKRVVIFDVYKIVPNLNAQPPFPDFLTAGDIPSPVKGGTGILSTRFPATVLVAREDERRLDPGALLDSGTLDSCLLASMKRLVRGEGGGIRTYTRCLALPPPTFTVSGGNIGATPRTGDRGGESDGRNKGSASDAALDAGRGLGLVMSRTIEAPGEELVGGTRLALEDELEGGGWLAASDARLEARPLPFFPYCRVTACI